MSSSDQVDQQQQQQQQQDGPDRVLPAASHTTTDPRSAVLLRVGDTPHDSHAPLSVPTLLSRAAKAEGADRAAALAVKRDGAWVKWSYAEYRRDVRDAAKALIKLGLEPR